MKNPRIFYHGLDRIADIQQLSFDSINGVEFDLRMTRDHEVVVRHDRRIQNGDARFHWIDEMNFSELRDIEGEHIQRFADILPILLQESPDITLDLDLKQPGMENYIAAILKENNAKEVLVCSSEVWVLKSFEEAFPNSIIGLSYYPQDKWDLWDSRTFRYLSILIQFSLKPFLFRLVRRKTKKGDIEIASLNHKLVNEKVVEFLKQYNIGVYVWGTESEKRLRELVRLGVDGIKTKRPELLKKILNNKE